MKNKQDLAAALIVTAEVMGSELSTTAAKAMVRELESYPPGAVASALKRCQRELGGRLTLAAILQRIDDGWPAPEAAWALCQPARDESNTVVWTDEIAQAFGIARELLKQGDHVAARMAFLEDYRESLRAARAESRLPRWWASLGHDRAGRASVVLDAVERRQLTADYARELVAGNALAETRLRRLEGRKDDVALQPPDATAIAALVAQAAPKRLS